MKKKVLVIHGPNINLVGEREPGIYGKESFESINEEIRAYAEKLGFECEIYQSNCEGEIIDKLQAVRHEVDGIVANMGAYTTIPSPSGMPSPGSGSPASRFIFPPSTAGRSSGIRPSSLPSAWGRSAASESTAICWLWRGFPT